MQYLLPTSSLIIYFTSRNLFFTGQTKNYSMTIDGDDHLRLVSPTATTNFTNEDVEYLDDEKMLWQGEHSNKSPFTSTNDLQRKEQCFISGIADKIESMLIWRNCLRNLFPSSRISNSSFKNGMTIVCSVDLIRRWDWNLENLIFANEKALSSFILLTKEVNSVIWIFPALSDNFAVLNISARSLVKDPISIKL